MYEASEALAEMVERLIEAVKPLERGDLLGHDTIGEILGVAPHTLHWQACVNKLKRHMEAERGISLWIEHTVGYKLCTIPEQLELGHIYLVRARRRIRRGIKAIAALPQKGLNLHQQKQRAAHQTNLSRSHRDLSASICHRLPTQVASPTLPRPPHPQASQHLAEVN